MDMGGEISKIMAYDTVPKSNCVHQYFYVVISYSAPKSRHR